jgi:hypothetical protein
MRAINLTLQPVELAPVNGAGLLAPATEDSEGRHERELEEVTEREEALARAGTIMLADSAGRKRAPKPAPQTGDGDDKTGGEGS